MTSWSALVTGALARIIVLIGDLAFKGGDPLARRCYSTDRAA